ALEELYLTQNNFRFIPKSLGQLPNLHRLYLDQNKIDELPKELGKLSNLRVLFLNQNRIQSLPKEIGQLKNLKELNLSENQLTSLSKEIGNLTKLEVLYAGWNKLKSLPKELGNLNSLEILHLNENCLEYLPKSLTNLNQLATLYLHGNSKLELSYEILGPSYDEDCDVDSQVNPQDILDYYYRILDKHQPLNEAKLIVVGFGSVGKTSLVNRLIHNEFNPISQKTDGIRITQWPIKINQTEDIKLNIWDFGGQEIMHATHQFFLTERSLYLLVLNGRQGHEDADAEYWLELIQSFGGNSPVIIVLNKIGEQPFDVNRRALQEKFSSICEFVQTDCELGIGIDELQSVLKQETDRLEHLRDPFPASWFEIKNRLAEMSENYISFEEYRKICREHGEHEQNAQDSLAIHLHSLGIALNYKDDTRLRDTHILNPHWVTNGIYTLLNAHELTTTKGELELACMARNLDLNKYPPERHGFILELMRKFELCFQFEEKDSCYLIPDLLDKQQPPEASDFIPAECLNFRYEYSILPEGLLPRFIVRSHVLSLHQPRWRTGVILHFEGNRALVKADPQEKCVTINIDGPLLSRRRLLTVIRSDFDRIHSSFKSKPKELVPVPGHPNVNVSYKELLIREKKGKTSFDELDAEDLIELNVRDLLNGVDIEGSRQQSLKMDRLNRPLSLFYSYSHKDEALRDQLDTHLKILQRQQLIQPWHDRRIVAGENYTQQIDDHLSRADIILLLISADFIASDYCYNIELEKAMARHYTGDTKVIPIILRSTDWKNTPFKELQAFPTNAKPITLWSDRDEAWLNVETSIKQAIEDIKAQRYR
ncbi:MAG: GTP-binding protein, partial [Leptolyngbya sp. SIO3F4]|nr:GTP-binding protein [Leptolyngbya sp. SIO3F4]